MKIRSIKNKNIKWWVGIGSCVSLFAVIMVFGYEKMCFVWRGVEIQADIERDASSSLTTITGKASKATHLTLNGREIFIDKDGNFSEEVSVLPGFSVITLDAKDKFGKTALKKFEVVYDGNAQAIALNNYKLQITN